LTMRHERPRDGVDYLLSRCALGWCLEIRIDGLSEELSRRVLRVIYFITHDELRRWFKIRGAYRRKRRRGIPDANRSLRSGASPW
jgi:hypothetical protein